jgi:hypothetical protein
MKLLNFSIYVHNTYRAGLFAEETSSLLSEDRGLVVLRLLALVHKVGLCEEVRSSVARPIRELRVH